MLWHNAVTRRSKKERKKSAYFPLAASVSSSLDVSFAVDGCGSGGDGGVCGNNHDAIDIMLFNPNGNKTTMVVPHILRAHSV